MRNLELYVKPVGQVEFLSCLHVCCVTSCFILKINSQSPVTSLIVFPDSWLCPPVPPFPSCVLIVCVSPCSVPVCHVLSSCTPASLPLSSLSIVCFKPRLEYVCWPLYNSIVCRYLVKERFLVWPCVPFFFITALRVSSELFVSQLLFSYFLAKRGFCLFPKSILVNS